MRWGEVIELGQQKEQEIHHEIIKSWEYRQIFANKKSVRQSEFYQAATVGLRPEMVFEIHSEDFEGEERVRYNGKEYVIIRVYEQSSGQLELTVRSWTGSDE